MENNQAAVPAHLTQQPRYQRELFGLDKRRTKVSLCPRGLLVISRGGLEDRLGPNDESSWEREKKSSSPSYGDVPEFICVMPGH